MPIVVLAWALLLADPLTPPTSPAPAVTAPAPRGRVLSSEDYPAAALRAGEEGRVGYRLVVSPDGRPTECAITSSSHSASLDAETCRILLRRARFSPARDGEGRPTTGIWEGAFTWKLSPLAEEAPPAR